MEVYEGPFDPLGQRHGDGATCAKMDGGVKFLGRYHTGQMHGGTLIVADEAGAGAFTHPRMFLGGDFDGVGDVGGSDGSICQGQLKKKRAVPRGGHAADHGRRGGPGREPPRGT